MPLVPLSDGRWQHKATAQFPACGRVWSSYERALRCTDLNADEIDASLSGAVSTAAEAKRMASAMGPLIASVQAQQKNLEELAATFQAALDKSISDRQDLARLVEARKVQLEFRDGVPVPAIVVVLGSGSVDVSVTWEKPFPDTAYRILAPQVQTTSVALIGRMTAVVKSKTVTGCVVTVTSTAALSVSTASLSVLAFKQG